MFRKKVSSYRRHFIGDPLIAYRIVFPEVLVRIKSHKDELWSEQCVGTSITAYNSSEMQRLTQIKKSAINGVVHAGDKRGFIRTQE